MEEITPKEVHTLLRKYLCSRSDLGLWKAIDKKIFRPQNPFEPPSLIKPQAWAVLLLLFTSAAIGAFVYFNLGN